MLCFHKQALLRICSNKPSYVSRLNPLNVGANHLMTDKMELIKAIGGNQSDQQFARLGKPPEICLRIST